MKTAQALGRVCLAAVTLVAAVACGGGSTKVSASNAAAGSTVSPTAAPALAGSSSVPGSPPAAATSPAATGAPAAPTTAAAPTTSVAATTSAAVQMATGGGDFCKAIAASLGRQASSAGTSPAQMMAQLAIVRKFAEQAASLAPAAIKPDVNVLMAASLSMWDALAKVNYDYSKLKPSDMAALSSPAVAAAGKRLSIYMTDTCGLKIGGAATASH
jgi:hypothetical protein